MTTVVCFHAHPDDESIATSGVMAKAKAEGHRVVLVVATRGEHGEVADDFLEPGEQLGLRRVGETFESARIIGIDRVEFLGYVDSGMMGEPTNEFPYCFWQADVEQAAHRLAAILREESDVVLTVYDDHGGYGHPDHIQVNRVGVRAAEMVEGVRVFESTMNRDFLIRQIAEGRAAAEEAGLDVPDFEGPDLEGEQADFGSPEELITHCIDVQEFVDIKRASMIAHASQIPPESFFLQMPEESFASGFGVEWFIEHGQKREPDAPFETTLWD
jgi:LmbE family N-acetylglucosaminyl deacetylase